MGILMLRYTLEIDGGEDFIFDESDLNNAELGHDIMRLHSISRLAVDGMSIVSESASTRVAHFNALYTTYVGNVCEKVS
jgi:hypothetical protein